MPTPIPEGGSQGFQPFIGTSFSVSGHTTVEIADKVFNFYVMESMPMGLEAVASYKASMALHPEYFAMFGMIPETITELWEQEFQHSIKKAFKVVADRKSPQH